MYTGCVRACLRACVVGERSLVAASVGGETLARSVGHGSSAYPHEFLERLPELRVEYRVDDRVDEAVHVAQPRGQYEHLNARRTLLVQFVANGVQYVAREERHPTEQEHA